MQKHPNAELLQADDEPTEPIRFGIQPYIHCIPVDPEPDRSNPIFTNLNVPTPIRTYYEHKYAPQLLLLIAFYSDPSCSVQLSDINTFSSSRSIVKGYYADGGQEIWTEKTYYTTEQLFPTVLRRSEVIDLQTVELSPVDSALIDVEEKTKELSQLHLKFETLSKIDAVSSTNALAMSLNDLVDAAPNTGLPLYRDVFLTTEYVQQSPFQEPAVFKLRSAMDQLVRLISRFWRLPLT